MPATQPEWTAFYAAIQLTEAPGDHVGATFHPFTYDCGQVVEYAHTNIPRSGEFGLPKGWEMDVRRITCITTHRMELPITVGLSVGGEWKWRGLAEPALLTGLTIHAALTIPECVPFDLSVGFPAGHLVPESPAVPGPSVQAAPIIDRLTAVPNFLNDADAEQMHMWDWVPTILAGDRPCATYWFVLEGPTRRPVVI